MLKIDNIVGMPVRVNNNLSLFGLLSLGAYDWVHPDLKKYSYKNSVAGIKETQIILIEFPSVKETQEILLEFLAAGIRPANFTETLTFGGAYKGIQKFQPVVGLGTKITIGGKDFAICLTGNSKERKLNLLAYDDNWASSYSFATVKIEKEEVV